MASANGTPRFQAIVFQVQCETVPGESVGLLGSIPCLGKWDKKNFVLLHTNKDLYPTWRSNPVLCDEREIVDPKENIEYKYVLLEGKSNKVKAWEAIEGNRALKVDHDEEITTEDVDGNLCLILNDGKLGIQSSHKHDNHGKSQQQAASNGPLNLPPPQSQPGNIARSVSSLEQLNDFGRSLAEHDLHAISWRKKLGIIQECFTDEEFAKSCHFDPENLEHLVYIHVYLNFLKSGQIQCKEDGTHYRPNHHANSARKIEMVLRKLQNESNAFLLRKIYPLLPSYSSEFTASVPLTRIRDIAHRGDIPHDMKQRIKHNLQNKLHRCAGPEDLVTCENILRDITSPGAQYSGEFINQMRIFYEELKEFFNAKGLEDVLQQLLNRGEPSAESVNMITKFLDAKRSGANYFDQLDLLLKVRQGFAGFMESLEDGEQLQRVRLADTQLEDYGFVLFANANQQLEHLDQSKNWAKEAWNNTLRTMILALENMALSGTLPLESTALKNDITSILQSEMDTLKERSTLLRLRAVFERASREADDFSSVVSNLYMGRVQTIAKALGVDPRAANVFAEAEIRANIVFQMSRCTSLAMKHIRMELQLPPWDVLSPGTAVGVLRHVSTLDELKEKQLGEPCVVILDTAEGDEEVPVQVVAIVLGHDLPHLSHLGVRTRQANCAFACAEEKSNYDKLLAQHRASLDTEAFVKIVIGAEGEITIEKGDKAKSKPLDNTSNGGANSSVAALEDTLAAVTIAEPNVSNKEALTFDKVDVTNGGAKSNFAWHLQQIASESKGLFSTPKSMVVPYGVFDACKSAHKAEYNGLVTKFNAGSLEIKSEVSAEMRRAIVKWQIPSSVVQRIQKEFADPSISLMVRSSANCEDLESMSGAGLYDSIANVPSDDEKAITKAILEVWASLWTKRASLSRSQYHVDHSKAVMAVLVQQIVNSQYSFVLFSNNPVVSQNGENEVYMEIAVGMGETLASAAARGSPYRFAYDKKEAKVREISLANYSVALVPSKDKSQPGGLVPKVVDYSQERMTTDPSYRESIVKRLGQLAMLLESKFDGPQDIEGAIVDDTIYLVQARPMVVHH